MSQKPKAAAPARPAPAVAKDMVSTPAPAKGASKEPQSPTDGSVAKAEPVIKYQPSSKPQAAAKVESPKVAAVATPAAVSTPDVKPAMTAPPVVALPVVALPVTATAVLAPPAMPVAAITEAVAKAEPMVAAVLKAEAQSVDQTIAAASDLSAASAKALSETITATADTVAAVTAEVAQTAAEIKPTLPTPLTRGPVFTSGPTITQGMKTMLKTTEDLVAFGQANLEAFVKSGQIWSAGVQELTKQMATSAKASFEDSVSTFKAISTAKSVKEAIDLQSTFAKAALEKAMAESNKLTDASIKLTEQTLAPITARVTVAVETFGKTATV
jgi:phasin family protein